MRTGRALVGLTLVVLAACGGAVADVGDPRDEGRDAAASPGLDGGRPTDATPAADALVGPISDSGRVSCGARECLPDGSGAGEVCCVEPGKPPSMTCTIAAACEEGRRACDDTTDCARGNVCCAETDDRDRMSTRCMPSCITGVSRWQVCKTESECPRGIPCTRGICPLQGEIGFCVGAALPDGCR